MPGRYIDYRNLSACRIVNGASSARARDAHIPFLHVAQGDIHHCRHQRIVEGVVLRERRDAAPINNSTALMICTQVVAFMPPNVT
jgi:hypothetical protein